MTNPDAFPIGIKDIWLRRELIAAGWTDRDIARHLKRGVIGKIRYGAYADAALLAQLDDRGRFRVKSRAVLRTAHPSSVLTHQSALAEWDSSLWRLDLGNVALTRTDGVAGRREAGVAHHRGNCRSTT